MKNRVLFLLKAYFPSLLWGVFIYILSAQSTLPSFDVSLYDFIFKKCSHMFVYGVFYFLLFEAVNSAHPEKSQKQKNWVVPFLICVCYASLDEIHQSFTPNRSPTLRDIGFDLLGSSISFLKIYDFI